MMRVLARAALAGGVLALGACGSMPFEMMMPGGEVLKGSASTTGNRGSFYATNGKVTCVGPFRPELFGHKVGLAATCSDTDGGDGEGQDLAMGGGGEGAITLNGGRTAVFRYGEATKSR
jgi:hypothetical protein